MTKLQLSSLSSAAPARFIVPLQVWAISACDLRVDRLLDLLFHAPRTNFKVGKLYHCSVAWFQSLLEPRDKRGYHVMSHQTPEILELHITTVWYSFTWALNEIKSSFVYASTVKTMVYIAKSLAMVTVYYWYKNYCYCHVHCCHGNDPQCCYCNMFTNHIHALQSRALYLGVYSKLQ